MDFVPLILNAAREVNCLGMDESLVEMDSIQTIELVMAVEASTGVSIPPTALKREHFGTVSSLARLLERLSSAA